MTATDVLATTAQRATGLLAGFNRAGILTAADVHVAQRVGALGGETDEAVLLALAMTVRSTRQGSVVLDLDRVKTNTSVDGDVDTDDTEPRPETVTVPDWPENWVARVAASPLVGGPLRRVGSKLWLARYWDQETMVAGELVGRCSTAPDDLDLEALRAGLDRLFNLKDDDDQRAAAAVCAMARVSVLAGGPGTGKTTTVSKLLAVLREQHPDWRIALAAPTGKAAARLEEAVRSSTATLPAEDQTRLGDLSATTLHRLLGWRPEARTRFRHDRGNRLPFEVVVVDESSMLSLTMMARLLEALRPSTRLVLVGDPDQLASVEAGAVLGDLVDRESLGARTPARAANLASLNVTDDVPQVLDTPGARVADGVAMLLKNRRFSLDSSLGKLAAAVRDGNTHEALAVLAHPDENLELVEVSEGAFAEQAVAAVRRDVEQASSALQAAALDGDAEAALRALDSHRILCAHRRGLRGVAHWSALASRWSAGPGPTQFRADGHYLGEPLLVTTNDYDAGLYNGDTGVVIADSSGGSGDLVAAFGRGGAPILLPLVRLGAVTRLHAMTVHRSQGSQFARVTVILPPVDSPLGTRQTLYTAITRSEGSLRLVGSVDAIRAAIDRPAARATGLRERL